MSGSATLQSLLATLTSDGHTTVPDSSFDNPIMEAAPAKDRHPHRRFRPCSRADNGLQHADELHCRTSRQIQPMCP